MPGDAICVLLSERSPYCFPRQLRNYRERSAVSKGFVPLSEQNGLKVCTGTGLISPFEEES
jgi:hypothetical protein